MRLTVPILVACSMLSGMSTVMAQSSADATSSPVATTEEAVSSSRSVAELSKILRASTDIAEVEGAVAELEALATTGDASAALILGTEFTKDRGTLPVDYPKAVTYLDLAATLGMPEAYLTLATWHRRELGGLPRAPALGYLEKAANAGLNEALIPLGDAYRNGTYGPVDIPKAITQYAAALDAGDVSAAKKLVAVYRGEGDSQMVAKYTTVSADAGDTAAMMTVADMYLKGSEIPQDLALAEQYLRKAVDAGDPEAASILVRAFLRGQFGEDRKADGVALLEASLAAGDASQSATLADAYRRGIGAEPDLAKAKVVLQKGAELGDQAATSALLDLYTSGAGQSLAPDLNAARSLYSTIPEERRTGAVAENGALLAAISSDLPTTWILFQRIDAAAKSRTGGLILRQNKNAYVYVLQNLLTERGLYSGSLNGSLTSSTISAVNQFCAAQNIDCGRGPLLRDTWVAMAAAGL